MSGDAHQTGSMGLKLGGCAQVVGRLAEKRAATEQALQGLLVRHGAQDSLMHPSDLPYFTKLHPGRVLQRQLLALQKPFSEVGCFPPSTRTRCLIAAMSCTVR